MRRFLLALVAAASFSLAAWAQVGGLSFPGPQSPPQSGGGGGVVALAASSTGVGTSGATTSDSSPLAITLTSASNSILLVGLQCSGNPGAFTSFTWNGAAMTQVGTTYSGDSTLYIALFALLNPASGTGTYAATWTNSVNCARLGAQFSGVLQTSVAAAIPNVATNHGSASPATATVTSNNNDGAFWIGGTLPSVSWTNTITGGTFLKEASGTGIDGQWAYGLPTTTSTTISGTLFNSGVWDLMLVDIAHS